MKGKLAHKFKFYNFARYSCLVQTKIDLEFGLGCRKTNKAKLKYFNSATTYLSPY